MDSHTIHHHLNTDPVGHYPPVFALGAVQNTLTHTEPLSDRLLGLWDMNDTESLCAMMRRAQYVNDTALVQSLGARWAERMAKHDTLQDDLERAVRGTGLRPEHQAYLKQAFESERDALRSQLNPGTPMSDPEPAQPAH